MISFLFPGIENNFTWSIMSKTIYNVIRTILHIQYVGSWFCLSFHNTKEQLRFSIFCYFYVRSDQSKCFLYFGLVLFVILRAVSLYINKQLHTTKGFSYIRLPFVIPTFPCSIIFLSSLIINPYMTLLLLTPFFFF